MGKSIAHAKTVIGDGDGFGLEHILPNAYYKKYRGNEALYYVDGKGREKHILFVGGMKKDSYKSFHGYSITASYITEIQLMHEETVGNVLNRMTVSTHWRLFVDLNPVNSNHWIFSDYIDQWRNSGANYMHATMLDNPAMDINRIKKEMNRYDMGSVRYKRNVLGRRVAADGVIFTGYHKSRLLIEDFAGRLFHDFSVGVDFGTRDRTVFTLIGFTHNYRYAVVISTWSHQNPKDGVKKGATEYIQDFIDWIEPLRNLYPKIRDVWVDSASGGFKRSLAIKLKTMSNLKVRDSIKGTILDRITTVEQLMSLGALKIHKDCHNLFNSLESQVWDSKAQENGKDERLDNGTVDIDSADSFEYAIYPYSNKILARWGFDG